MIRSILHSLLFLLLFWPLCHAIAVTLHEAGHALAARLVGARIHAIVIGIGRDVGVWRLWGYRLILRRLPFSGAVWMTIAGEQGYRWRQMLVFAAGPLVSLLLFTSFMGVWVVAVLIERTGQSPAMIGCLALGMSSLLGLLPFDGTLQGVRVASDGKQLIALARMSEAELAAHREQAAAARRELDLWATFFGGRFAEALARIREQAAADPANDQLALTESIYRWPVEGAHAALERTRELLESKGPESPVRVELLVNAAYFAVEAREPDRLESAAACIAEAQAIAPGGPAVVRVAGMVQARRGELREARSSLQASLHGDEMPEMRAISHAYLAIVSAKLGKWRHSAIYLRRAARAWPHYPELAAARAEVASLAAQHGS